MGFLTGELAVLAFTLGLAIGSFLNVVIYRVPRGETLLGRSHCPRCDYQIAAYDNIPVVSWLLLRGRCRKCQAPISFQYPAIEAVTGVLFAAVTLVFGASLLTLALLVFMASSVALFMIDIQTLRLPDAIVGPTSLVVAGGIIAACVVEGSLGDVARVALAAAVVGTAYFSLWFITGGKGLGFGDVKLAPLLGAVLGYFGWGSVAVGTAAAWLLGAIVGVSALLLGRVSRGKPIPFGPFLLVGTWIGIFFGQDIWGVYLNATGITP